MSRPLIYDRRKWRFRRARQVAVVLTCLGFTAYFAHHAWNGRHGFEARSQLIERIALLEFELKSLEAVRTRLTRDIALLATDPPHPDLVEEVARDVLGFAHPADRILSSRP